jgi:hypothetical protein
VEKHERHEDQRNRQPGGNRRARPAACGQSLARALDGKTPGRRNEQKEEQQLDEPHAAIDRLPPKLRERIEQHAHARMLSVAQRPDAADTHQPSEQDASELFGPRNRLAQDVPAHHLEADNDRLGDHEDGDGCLKRAVRA